MIYIKFFFFLFFFFKSNYSYSEFNYNLKPIKIDNGIYVILGDNSGLNSFNGGAISNTGFIIGEDEILIIDAGPSYIYAEEVIEIIKGISSLPIKYLVVTHHHPDHSFGISKYSELDLEIIISASEIIRYEKYGKRLLNQMKNLIGEQWFKNTKIIKFEYNDYEFPQEIDLGNHKIIVNFFKNGHSEGDLVVEIVNKKIVFAGDIVFSERVPTIPHANIDNWSIYIDELIDSDWMVLIPGHGPLIYEKYKLYSTKRWINYIDKVAKNAVELGLSPAEVFETGLSEEFKKYKLSYETWLRDLPLLMKKYEFE